MKSKYTEGPWDFDTPFTDEYSHTTGHYTRDLPVLECVLDEGDEYNDGTKIVVEGAGRKEIAALISAAPELLDAAKHAANVLAAWEAGENQEPSPCLLALRSAIAKAEGRKS